MKKSNVFKLQVRHSDELRIVIIDGMEIKSIKVPNGARNIQIKRGRK